MKGFSGILIVLLLSSFCPLFSIELEGYNINKKLISLEKSGPPEIIDNYIIFTLENDEKPSFVGAAFDFENYTKIHQYYRTQTGIYYLVINKPETDMIRYRVIIDGIWQADPHSLKNIKEFSGVEISIFPLPDVPDNENIYPLTENAYTLFYHRGKPGSSVYLTGSFNNWDPFMYRMEEKKPGEYYFRVRLNPGEHYYYFIENGMKIADKRNPEVVWDRDYNEISAFILK